MKKINFIILMIMIGTSIYSMNITTLVRINILEKAIEKKFIIGYSQISNAGEPINCEVEIDLFENSGLVRLIGKNIIEVNELIIKTEMGFFDEYFKKIIGLIKEEGNYKDYKINLIFVADEGNKLIGKRNYII